MNDPLERYRAATPRSAARQERAARVLPGGDTRYASWHAPYPLTLERGDGAQLHDVDGNRYLDLNGNYTSLVHGYGFGPVLEATQRALAGGTAWSARCDSQLDLAELLCQRVASVESVRFTNSGTEAGMLAARLVRAVTGRPLLLMARHGYHGGFDDLEIGLLGQDGPRTLVAPHGDAAAFERLLAERGSEIAGVFLEPVMGSAGIVASPPGFLGRVAAAARAAGALLVLDEVICLRLGVGGAQEAEGVRPDLTMLGKLIGGGFPIGAVGGRADLMALLAPDPLRVFHSGTFNGNPVSTAAGAAALAQLTADRITAMDALGARLAAGLTEAAAAAALPFSLRRSGSLLNLYFADELPAVSMVRTDAALMARVHLACLTRGLFFAPRGMLALSTAFTEALVDEAVERAAAAFSDAARLPAGVPA